MTDKGFMLGFQVIDRFYMLAWHDQNMYRCGWMDIQKSDYLLVLVNDRARAGAIDDFAEDAGWIHRITFRKLEFRPLNHYLRFRSGGLG